MRLLANQNPAPRGGDRRLELAYFQGRRARNEGRALSSCPYVRGSAIARAWADGWREATSTRPNPSRKKRKPSGGDWQPDLFGGRGIEREGATRAEQLQLARDEMRRTASSDLFDLLADKERNPGRWRKVALTTDKRGRPVAYIRTSNQPDRYIRIGYDEARVELATGRATQEPFRPLGRNPADTPEMRYQRAVGHGERPSTARKAASNPGRAVGRMTPNCPMCGGLVRLPNPIPRTVRCAGCGAESLVRRP